MERRVVLGVQKRKKPRRRNRKTLLKKVVDYLNSDSYMFAPLISPPVSDFLASRTVLSASTAGAEMKETVKGKSKSVAEKVGEYLKSDTYFYSPLFDSLQITSSKGVGEKVKRVKIQVFTDKLIKKSNKSAVEESKATGEKEVTSGQEKLVHKETVKHMVYQSCRSSSMSGKGMLDAQLRKCLVE